MSRYNPIYDIERFDREQIPSLYIEGDTVYLKGARGIDPTPYQIHKVLNDGQYRLSRDGRSDGSVYLEENLQKISESQIQELPNKVPKLQRKAKSSTGASLEKADKDHTTVRPEEAENIQLATGKAKTLDDTGTSLSELDDTTGTSLSKFDDDDVLKEVRATNDQAVTGNAKELDTGASLSGLDDDDVLEELR